ncbi:Zinc finger CCCH domain-containing protein 42, variant 2 [Balamuthia mandrillaris]
MEEEEAEKTGEASPVGGSAALNGGEKSRKPIKKKPSASTKTKAKKKKKKSESAASASAPTRQQKKKRSSTMERNAKLCSNQKKEKEKVREEEEEEEEVPEEEEERNLETLPLEVQLRVLYFLKVYDAHALARTSTYWRHLVLSEIKFWNARWQREEPQEQSRQLLFRLWRDDELLWKGRAEDHILHVFNTFYQERVAFLHVHFAFICEQLIKEVTLKLALHLKEAKRDRKTEKKKKETKRIAEKRKKNEEEEEEEEETKRKTTNKRIDAQPDEATEKSIKHKKDQAETKREKKRKTKKDKVKKKRQTGEEAAKTSETENNIATSNTSKTQQNQTEKKEKQKKTTVKAMEKEKEQQHKKKEKKQPKQRKGTLPNRAQDDNDGECSALSSARATVLPQIIAMLLRTIFILERPDEGVALLIKRRCVKLVLNAMECFPQHNRVQQWGCAALHNLCVIDSAEKKVMKKKGLDLVLTALDRFPDDVDVQDWGCGLVSVIAYNRALISSLFSSL